ncbi:MAG: DoxX family protein [Pseudomonadota bacterium]
MAFLTFSNLYPIGRAGLASLFLLGGINKLSSFTPTLQKVAEGGLHPPLFFLSGTILIELGLGLALAFGTRFAPAAALGLAAFTLATNAIFHRFWELSGELAALELSLFFKNVAISGALLAVAAVEKERGN